ncbi:type II toxin-antitoxin system YoeB family toxin [Candidatus Venteria ishoeyi]|nr:type II toxin-antitoxin system YoeB family toxin [Candidatus Venteria ishoeyi]
MSSSLLKEMPRDNPTTGIGKPEPLKHNLSSLTPHTIYRFSGKEFLEEPTDNTPPKGGYP